MAHLTVSTGAQMMKLSADKRSMGNPGIRTSSSWMLTRQTDRGFLEESRRRMSDWNHLLAGVEGTIRSPLRPQTAIKAVSDLIADDTVISLDCGANTHFAARHLRLRPRQRLTGTGMLATMGPGLAFAIAAQIAWPSRQSVAMMASNRRRRRLHDAAGRTDHRRFPGLADQNHRTEE